jgi:hypothetical protein
MHPELYWQSDRYLVLIVEHKVDTSSADVVYQ